MCLLQLNVFMLLLMSYCVIQNMFASMYIEIAGVFCLTSFILIPRLEAINPQPTMASVEYTLYNYPLAHEMPVSFKSI